MGLARGGLYVYIICEFFLDIVGSYLYNTPAVCFFCRYLAEDEQISQIKAVQGIFCHSHSLNLSFFKADDTADILLRHYVARVSFKFLHFWYTLVMRA